LALRKEIAMRSTVPLSLATLAVFGFAAPALAQAVLPSPAIDQPKAPLAGPPMNQPPRQLPPEPDAASDPALANARNPPRTLGRDRSTRAVIPPTGTDRTTLTPPATAPH
jgi:hypothetical protein